MWLSFWAILAITFVYLAVAVLLKRIPAASELFGHALGIFGFTLMVMTETLYSIRKRRRHARWGRMSTWLSFHIITGIVGPYMVLLHSSWKYHGLAGLVTLLTVLVVFSGFVGRYIYTALPRTADEVEMEADQIDAQILQIETSLRAWMESQPVTTRELPAGLFSPRTTAGGGLALILGRPGLKWRLRRQWKQYKDGMAVSLRPHLDQLERLARRKELLQRQKASLATARRLFAIWHAIHIPLGLVLFTAALIHIGAAIYYAGLL